MMTNIMIGMSNVFQPENLLFCLGGLAIGIIFGSLP